MDIANACLKYLLLDAFADGPAVSDCDGRDTPMDDRLEQQALLAYAAFDAMTQTGRTPLDIAMKEGEEVIAWLLFSEGGIFEREDTASGIVLKRFKHQRHN